VSAREDTFDLPDGLYESLIDTALARRIEALSPSFESVRQDLDAADSHAILARHVAEVLQQHLRELPSEGRVEAQAHVCNSLLAMLKEKSRTPAGSDREVELPAEQLMAVVASDAIGRGAARAIRPETPLSSSSLLTGTRIDPSLISQLRKEIQSADEIDILCSFVKWSGIRILADELRDFTLRDGVRLRVITTSYMGATDPKAIDFLHGLPNCEVRISYDTKRTRLHAKAYLFHRRTGFGAAYVGSANLSHAAITDGLEWNLKVSQTETPHIWSKAAGTFHTYWNDREFVPYAESERERFRIAIVQERAHSSTEVLSFQFDITPYGYQQEILDKLEAERTVHGRSRNLIVAATGTGKTVVAALDYRRECQRKAGANAVRRPRLLFVAHREEILRQSLACFRAVLKDQNFGDLFVGDHVPEQHDHLFVSIQTWNSRNLAERFDDDHFEFVVVDEFHHAEARSYSKLLDHINPWIMLGLTATPERGDALDILHHFGGRIAAEIRLPDAINRKLLAPFQYFGITDSVDLSALRWQRGGYVPAELEERFTGNDARADLIVRSVKEKLTDYRLSRGLGFCISVKHAEYMAGYFNKCGIPSLALTGESARDLRAAVQKKLVARDINFIFTVDLYNEGVDIPELDTVLFLRPTESLTVFLQQLGRGLRLHDDKECLTVLDFIGQAHQNFRFELRFRALMDSPRHRMDKEIEQGCLHLPLGCVVQLERIAQRHILDNIRAAISINKTTMVRKLKSFEGDSGKPLTLGNFLAFHDLAAEDIYRRSTWSEICAEAGVRYALADPDTGVLHKGLLRMLHLNSVHQINALLRMLDMHEDERSAQLAHNRDARQRMQIAMVSLFTDMPTVDVPAALARLDLNPTLKQELIDLLEVRIEQIGGLARRITLPFPCSLDLHGDYSLDEILVAFGYEEASKRRSVRQGVLHLPHFKADAFFVTLNKSDSDYSPTTMYEDYAISDTLFHWQSQSTTSDTSNTGVRYARHNELGYTPLLFVREDKTRDGLPCPYTFLGPVEYVDHSGSRPMSITWRMLNPIPARLLAVARRLIAA
jgi:superfamily II DNA or RNA helicase